MTSFSQRHPAVERIARFATPAIMPAEGDDSVMAATTPLIVRYDRSASVLGLTI